MDKDPFYIKLLEKLGVNTTKIRWRLYRMEQDADRVRKGGAVPSWLEWLRYEHKICAECGAINDRKDSVCHSCEKPLPSVAGYRVRRILGLLLPKDSPAMSTLFVMLISIFFGITLVLDGMSAFGRPSPLVLMLLGGFSNQFSDTGMEWWRWFGFSLAHGGIIHIGFNAYATMQIGPLVESQIGQRRMLVLITFCQFTAALATYFWYQQVNNAQFMTIGASGWVFGLIGYGTAFFHRMGPAGRPYRDSLFKWVIFALIFGILIGANNAAHLGGMLGGAALAFVPEARNADARQRSEQVWNAAYWVSLIVWGLTLIFVAQFALTHLDLLQSR